MKLLVLTHGADPESCAVRKNEFPVIVRLPLYAAIKSGGWPSAPPVSPGILSFVPVFEMSASPLVRLLTLPGGFTGRGRWEALRRAEPHAGPVAHAGSPGGGQPALPLPSSPVGSRGTFQLSGALRFPLSVP